MLSLIVASSVTSFAQQLDTNRYKNSMFSSQAVYNVQYSTVPQWIWPYWNVDLSMDIFEPTADLNTKRPLIIFAHAGGFINGSKDVDNMQAICDTFARKGFVTATIDYRKGFDPLDEQSAVRAVYRAVQDGKTAVRFFKENHAAYNVDTNNVFFGGMSAGGFIAYHVAYLDQESERPNSTYGGGTVNNLGCLDCAGSYQNNTSEIKAVLDYWGATIDTTFMQAGDQPIMIMHGTQDPTVPYYEGYPFGLPTLPLTFGADPIKNQAESVGVPYTLIKNDMDIHMMEGSSNGTWNPIPNYFWADTLLPFTTSFVYDLIKPNTVKISPDTVYLGLNEVYTFQLENHNGSQYIWEFNNLDITELTNNNESDIELQFVTPGTYSIEVTEFNNILAAGDRKKFVAQVQDDVGLSENEVLFNLYPNPANQIVQFSASEIIDQIEIMDVNGKIVHVSSPKQNSIAVDVSFLDQGIYFVRFSVGSELKSMSFSKM